jgi:hypothetical protein
MQNHLYLAALAALATFAVTRPADFEKVHEFVEVVEVALVLKAVEERTKKEG